MQFEFLNKINTFIISKNHNKKFYSLSIIFLIITFLFVFLLSDIFITKIIQNKNLLNFFIYFRWTIILLIFLLSFLLIILPMHKSLNILNKNLRDLYLNNKIFIEHLSEDFFFYTHSINKPFSYLSPNVISILGYSIEEFINKMKENNAFSLFNNRFNLLNKLINSNIPIPTFEVQLFDKYGKVKYFEVKEVPILNEKKEIVEIHGIAKNITQYKENENYLKEKEKLYQLVFQNSNDAIFIMKNDIFIDCNQKAAELFDLNVEEIISYSPYYYRFSPHFQPNNETSQKLALEYINKAYEGIPQKFEWIHLKRGSIPFTAEISLRKFSYNNEDFLLVVMKDITEEKKLIQKIKESESYTKNIIQNINAGIIVIDSNFNIRFYNDNFIKILKINNIMDSQFFLNRLKDILSKTKSTTFTLSISNPISNINLELLIAINNLNKNSNEFVITIIDIYEKVKLLNEILTEKELLKELLKICSSMLYRYNLQTNKYDYVSDAVLNITGYTPEEFINLSTDEMIKLIHPDDLKNKNFFISKIYKIEDLEKINKELIFYYRIIKKNNQIIKIRDKIKVTKINNDYYIIGEAAEIKE